MWYPVDAVSGPYVRPGTDVYTDAVTSGQLQLTSVINKYKVLRDLWIEPFYSVKDTERRARIIGVASLMERDI